ncbi:MAG TPA: hypothetical protein VJ785_07905 [Anaerolineales bacterium]|nr:hypothetical protein [Anaerolineales bacterium]
MRLPEQHHIPVVSVDLLINIVVLGSIAEINTSALAKVMLEEIIQLIEQLFPETLLEGLAGSIDIFHKLGKDAFFKITGFDLHQVDIA